MIPPVSQNTASPPSTNVCLVSCRRVLAQIEKTKSVILGEFRGILQAQEQFLRLALNEAEETVLGPAESREIQRG